MSEAPRVEAPPRSRAGYPWWMGPAAWLGALLVRLIGVTWRIEWVGIAEYDAALARGERCVFALWHARMFPLVFTHRGRGAAVLVSRHRDGELITRIIGHLGFVAGRGSSTRGGEEGLREMIEWGERGRLLAITPDGPRGPAEQVKPGLIYLAGHLGWPIVPVASASSRFWKLRSWDGYRIPKPFARVVVGYGTPIPIARDLDREGIERARDEVEAALAALTREMDVRAGAAA